MRVSGNAWHTGRLALVLLGLTCLCGTVGASVPDKADVRVLIDISGSMQQNDPDNLRRPALRMLAGLLQPGTRAGVWTFARWVNNLVPVAEVDPAWKKRTQSLSEQINSPGQFTNIEEVLDRASRDWRGQEATHARHLVLLTDGMVDVSKDPAENAQSRARIIDELLPRLQGDGVKVHTIALSPRADHELMKRLAGETGGWYQQVDRADELQRVFLRMFEKVGNPDAVPLDDNRFVVDSSINEATVLVFTRPGSPPVVLRSPSGEEFTDSDLPAGVAWFRDQGYNLITIASPQKGEWTLQADVDPDNRVMIVTDLKLQTSEVPTHIAVGEQSRVEAHLVSRGELVSRHAFLKLLNVRADTLGADGSVAQSLNDLGEKGDEKAGDGRYAMLFAAPGAAQELELRVAVDSPTFMREKRFRLVAHEVADGTVSETPDGPMLDIAVATAVMQPGAAVEAWQQEAAGGRVPLQPVERESGRWQIPLNDSVSPAFVRISGTTRLGNLVERTVGPLTLPGVVVPVVAEVESKPEAPAVQPVEPAPVQPATPVAEVEPTSEPVAEAPTEEEAGWILPAVMFGGFNLTLLLGGGAWWWLRRRRGGGDDDLELDDLVDDAPQAGESEASIREDAA